MTGLMIDDTNELERRVQCGVAWIRYFRLHELFFFCTYIFHPATQPAKGNIGCNIATSERITQPRGKRVGSQEAGESQVLGSAAVISSHFYPYLPISPHHHLPIFSLRQFFLFSTLLYLRTPTERFFGRRITLIASCRPIYRFATKSEVPISAYNSNSVITTLRIGISTSHYISTIPSSYSMCL